MASNLILCCRMGTDVHLNSGSSIRYPINFIKGQQGKFFLTGEAFFDVARRPKAFLHS